MSQKPYPRSDRTDRTTPGSAPAEPPGGQTELERQRAQDDLPGRPTRDPLRDDASEEEPSDERSEERSDGSGSADVEVPPEESVPDDVAEHAAASIDARTAPRERDRDPSDDPMRTTPSTGDVAHPPSDNA